MSLFQKMFSAETYVQRVEVFVILAVLAFFAYIAYSLRLFKKD